MRGREPSGVLTQVDSLLGFYQGTWDTSLERHLHPRPSNVIHSLQDTETAQRPPVVRREGTWHTRAHTCMCTCTHAQEPHSAVGNGDILPLATTRMGLERLVRNERSQAAGDSSHLTSCGITSKTQTRVNTQLAAESREVGARGLAERRGCRVKGATPRHRAQSWCGCSMWLQVAATA